MNFSQAQARYDAMLPRDESYFDAEPIIDEMVAEQDCFSQWLSCPPSVAALLSLIEDRGLPRMDKSERDDDLRDMYVQRIKSVRDDFTAWADKSERGNPSPMDEWRRAA